MYNTVQIDEYSTLSFPFLMNGNESMMFEYGTQYAHIVITKEKSKAQLYSTRFEMTVILYKKANTLSLSSCAMKIMTP